MRRVISETTHKTGNAGIAYAAKDAIDIFYALVQGLNSKPKINDTPDGNKWAYFGAESIPRGAYAAPWKPRLLRR